MTLKGVTFEEFISIFLRRDYKEIKYLLSTGNFDINSEDYRGVTALHCAAELDDIVLIKLILEQPKARINVKTLNIGSTPLMIAAGNDKVEALKYLLECGADASKTNNHGFTALMIAAEAGSVECVKSLLKAKDCNVNAQNHFGLNALMLGIKYPRIVELLLNVTDLSQEDENQENVLHYACTVGNLEIFRMLLDKNVFDINKENLYGEGAVHLAIKRKNFELAELLIKKGADLLHRDANQLCGYFYIVIYDDSETFLDKLVCPDDILPGILQYASEHNRTKTLKKFLEKLRKIIYNDVELCRLFFGVALNSAAHSGALDCVKYLLSTNMIDEKLLYIALMKAIQGNNYECFRYIYDNYPDNLELDISDFLPIAIDSGCFGACKLILELKEVDPNGPDSETYLMAASANGNIGIVKLLVEKGADINRIHENMGSALLLAVINDNLDIVKYLLDHGADITISDENGYTPLISAAFYGRFEIFNEIYSRDKNIHHRAKDGLTVFLAACCSGDVEILKKTLKEGANVKDVDLKNCNCLHLAAEEIENLSSLIYLLEYINDLHEMLISKNNDGKTPLDLIISHSDQQYLFSILATKVEFNKYLICPKNIQIEANENEDMCLICRDEFSVGDQITQLPCRHLFHENCFVEWSVTKANCPYCQRFPFGLKF